jgi:hypothetical protein
MIRRRFLRLWDQPGDREAHASENLKHIDKREAPIIMGSTRRLPAWKPLRTDYTTTEQLCPFEVKP